MVKVEEALAERFGWSLYEMDLTDMESMLIFLTHLNKEGKGSKPRRKKVFADQVNWL